MVHFRARIITLWERVRFSYWFVPTVMVVTTGLASFLTLHLDAIYNDRWTEGVRWFYTGDPDGARVLLSAIAASMIGIAGVVFSITIVALTLTSSQFGPRLLRNFMRDLGNQVTLGTFTATFVYCLLILRTIHGNDDSWDRFIPQLSLFIAFLLALASLGVLIYFIHHTALVIQAPVVIASLARDLQSAARELPETLEQQEKACVLPDDFDSQCVTVPAGASGYIQRIEISDVVEDAQRADVLVAFTRRPGHYVQEDEPVLSVYPAHKVDDELCESLQQTFSIAEQRTLSQDPEYAVDQLVEIAVRALSPGVNDPTTAMQCVDRLGEGMSIIAARAMPEVHHFDCDGNLRLRAWEYRFAAFLNTAFSRIRQSANTSLPVLIRLLDALTRVARCAANADRRNDIQEHAVAIYDLATKLASASTVDSRALERHYAILRAALNGDRAEGLPK